MIFQINSQGKEFKLLIHLEAKLVQEQLLHGQSPQLIKLTQWVLSGKGKANQASTFHLNGVVHNHMTRTITVLFSYHH
jgi:hypothetical protein